jgi:hypothetical protein
MPVNSLRESKYFKHFIVYYIQNADINIWFSGTGIQF